jgi:hypothetical protein
MMISIKKSFVIAVFIVNAVLCFPTLASTILMVSFEDVVKNSELVFEGVVISQETRSSSLNGSPYTYFTFEILDVLKGSAPSGEYITLGFAGGTIDGNTLVVHDLQMPALSEKGIYFVESLASQLVNPLYGWQQGHYLVERDAVTGVEKVMPKLTTGNEQNRSNELITAPTLSNFKRTIRNQLGAPK